MVASLLAFVSFASVPEAIQLNVDGVARTALLYRPTVATAHPPVVFCWHGHGGNARYAARAYDFQSAWPEAVVVYGDGLPTPGGIVDPEGKLPGWDAAPRETNKDVRFFDALYAYVQAKTSFDRGRCFAMGHSNGGYFCYTLWAVRADRFAGFSPQSAAGGRMDKVPKPAFIVYSDKDPIVQPAAQRFSINGTKKLNGAVEPGTEVSPGLMQFAGVAPTVVYTHSNGHNFQKATTPWVVEFFKNLR